MNDGSNIDGVIHKMTDKQWDAMLAIHNTGPFRLIRAAAPYFRLTDGEDRSVINISSTSGVYGNAGQISMSLFFPPSIVFFFRFRDKVPCLDNVKSGFQLLI